MFAAGSLELPQVCGGPALSLFRPEELELLVAGQRQLDWEDLEDGAKYEGGYHAGHPTIVMFWKVSSKAHGCPQSLGYCFSQGFQRTNVPRYLK